MGSALAVVAKPDYAEACSTCDPDVLGSGMARDLDGDDKRLKDHVVISAAGPEQDGSPSKRRSHDKIFARGLLYSIAAGVADGSLTSFFQQLEATRKLQDPVSGIGAAADFVGYFVVFGGSMLAIGILVLAASLYCRSGTPSPGFHRWCGVEHVIPGMASGALWAGANTCSVLASHFLGMSLAFPLSQTAIIVNGLLGMFVFEELVGCQPRCVFMLSLVVIVIGAGLLSFFGRPMLA